MNLFEFGVIVYEAQKAQWEEGVDFETFVWKLSQLIDEDDRPENIDFNEYYADIQWKEKHPKKK